MHIENPLILGAGPAGCAAAIALARGGAAPILLDRDAEPGDAICGGFLSWETARRLSGIGIELAALGAHPVHELAIFAGNAKAVARLPHPAHGLSRHALDTAMRAVAREAGADIRVARATAIEDRRVTCADAVYEPDALFLATGKHDVRGLSRPREDEDPALGLRIRVPAGAVPANSIELHMFPGGYAGIVRQEDGQGANVCLALRKSLLGEAGGDPIALLARLANENPAFADRLTGDWRGAPCDTIGSVPYGWIAQRTLPGIYRLGDQAAVIPSLAGEGIDIAVTSGLRAAEAYLAGQDSLRFQHDMAQACERPVRTAALAWHIGEHRLAGPLATRLLGLAPALSRSAMRATRIA